MLRKTNISCNGQGTFIEINNDYPKGTGGMLEATSSLLWLNDVSWFLGRI